MRVANPRHPRGEVDAVSARYAKDKHAIQSGKPKQIALRPLHGPLGIHTRYRRDNKSRNKSDHDWNRSRHESLHTKLICRRKRTGNVPARCRGGGVALARCQCDSLGVPLTDHRCPPHPAMNPSKCAVHRHRCPSHIRIFKPASNHNSMIDSRCTQKNRY